MPYHDKEYKPESPKKTTEKKEDLVTPSERSYTPDVEKVEVEKVEVERTPEQTAEQNRIKQIEAEFKNIKPTVLSSKRSAFLNKRPTS